MLLLITLALGAAAIFYYFSTKKFDYWKSKNVPHSKPTPLLGNFGDFILCKKNLGSVEQEICLKFPDAPLVGAYFGTEPTLIVQDPELIKLVTTKDFYYFSNRELSDHNHKEGFNQNLFSTYGDRWKVLRQNLTPIFTSSKMKNMFYLIESCSRTFEVILDKEISISRKQEARDLFARFTMDCIGICAFGLDPKAMGDDNQNPFRRIGKLIFEPSYIFMSRIILRAIWPSIFYGMGLKTFPNAVDNFFNKLLTGVFQEREYKYTGKHDFVDLILGFTEKKYIMGDSMSNMKGEGREKIKIEVDNKLLVAQCVIFFAAGFETSATTASFTMYELAKHPEVQERVRTEIREWFSKHDGKLSYDCVSELPYLEQCVDETMRLYPVLGVITREVVEEYRFPDGTVVERGQRVHLPTYHMHHNPKYFPDPEAFRPERFAPENKHEIHPYTYFPFGDGPRICIGMRFARMQMYAGLMTILKKYRVELAKDMPRTLDFEPKSGVTSSKHGIQLNFIPLNDYKY